MVNKYEELGGTLTLIRHGESEANIINKAIRDGLLSQHPESFKDTPDREIRLSERGVLQAQAVGNFLCGQMENDNTVIFSSDHIRAQETAAIVVKTAHVSGPEPVIRIEPFLGERNWGHFHLLDENTRKEVLDGKKRDPLNFAMPAGELLLATRQRARQFLSRLSSRHSGEQVIAFSHGEFIEAMWAEIYHMSTEDQKAHFSGPEGNIRNCQVIQFQEYIDSNGISTFRKIRQCNPYLQDFQYWTWKPIVRKTFTADELLNTIVRDYPKKGYETWLEEQLKNR